MDQHLRDISADPQEIIEKLVKSGHLYSLVIISQRVHLSFCGTIYSLVSKFF